MKYIKRIITITIIAICFVLLPNITTISRAELDAGGGAGSSSSGSSGSSKSSRSITETFTGADDFIRDGEIDAAGDLNTDKTDANSLPQVSNYLYNILLAIGMITAVAIGSFLGIKYMISSVEDQAKIKELLVPYVAGCIVVFGAFGIWKLAVELFKVF